MTVLVAAEVVGVGVFTLCTARFLFPPVLFLAILQEMVEVPNSALVLVGMVEVSTSLIAV